MLQINRKQHDAAAVENQENTERESPESSGQSSTGEETRVLQPDTNTRKIQDSQDNTTNSEEDDPLKRGSVGYKDLTTSQTTAFVRFKKNSLNKLNNQGSYRPLFRHRGLTKGHKFFSNQEYNMSQISKMFEGRKLEFKESTISESQELEDSMENGCHEDELGGRDLYKDYQHNPVLECVNQILLRDQEEMETTTTYQQEIICKPNSKGTGRFSYHCHSIKEEGDEESFTEEGEEEIKSQSVESQPDHHADNHSNNDKENREQGNEEPLKLLVKDKTPSPPVKAQLLEEKACLLMASKRLTLVRNLEFEDLDKKDTLNVSSCPSHIKGDSISGRSQVPPALPPKPPQLGAKGLYRKRMNDARLNQNHLQSITTLSSASQDQESCLEYRPNQSECVSENQHDIPECKNLTENSVNCNHHDTRIPLTPHMLEKPRQRQILSNGSLILALNQDSSHQSLNNSHSNLEEKNNNFCITSSSFKEKLDNLNISDFQSNSNMLRNKVRSGGSVTIVQNDTQLDGHLANHNNHEPKRHKALIHNHTSPLKSNLETPPAVSKNSNHCNKIRVGSSVSSLITGSLGDSIVNELTKGEPEVLVLPRVSQMVRRFEDLGTGTGRELSQDDGDHNEDEEEEDGNNTLRCNFEEFKLEDVDMESVGSGEDGGRPAGDGAEARAAMVQNGNSNGSYEHFLEATGLSQKSILTPSRLYSNHRNVIKPKDVKHRSKVLKAAAVNGKSGGPVVKYWVEPFL